MSVFRWELKKANAKPCRKTMLRYMADFVRQGQDCYSTTELTLGENSAECFTCVTERVS